MIVTTSKSVELGRTHLKVGVQSLRDAHVREADLFYVLQLLRFWHVVVLAYLEERRDDIHR